MLMFVPCSLAHEALRFAANGLTSAFPRNGLGFTYAVSSPIRQSFALDASRSGFGAFKVIHAKDRTRRSLRAGFAAALHRGQDRVPVASALAFGVTGSLAEIGFVHTSAIAPPLPIGTSKLPWRKASRRRCMMNSIKSPLVPV